MDFQKMTVAELRELAKNTGIKVSSAAKKDEIVEILNSKAKEYEEQKKAGSAAKSADAGDAAKKTQAKSEKKTGTKAHVVFNSENKRPNPQAKTNSNLPQYDTRHAQHAPGKTEASESKKPGMVQESSGFDPDRVGEKKPIKNEAFTQEEFEMIKDPAIRELDTGIEVKGILELIEGYGFMRSANYLPGEGDVYVSSQQVRRFGLKTGDIICGHTRVRNQGEKFRPLLYVTSTNGLPPLVVAKRRPFEELTPIFPNEKLILDQPGAEIPMRIMDLLSPIGKGQRGMIVSPPKAGKTTLLKQLAKTISRNYEDINLLVLLIDERPEEVTDIRESIAGPNVEVIYSTFDELPEHHKRVAEMVLDRARRLVELKKDVVILLDSITRLARAYNLIVPPSGRTLSGGLDPAALHMPKKFFGAARNIREGGSLTILATALVETGSKMDDVVFEEFKGTGNMELVLDRKLSEKRIFPAIDISRSSTRRDDLLLTKEEQLVTELIRREMNTSRSEDTVEQMIKLFARTKTNTEFVELAKRSLTQNR